MKFYVSYVQDAGMPMECQCIIEAPNLGFAKSNWVKLIGQKGYVCSPMGDEPYEYDELIQVPENMEYWNDNRIFEVFDRKRT
jgi:hypothetical protein